MNKNKIIFFCDYGLNIGLGHLIRTISIAEIFLEIDTFDILFLLEKSFHLPNEIKNFNCKFFEKLENIDKPFSYLFNLILEENPKVFFIDSRKEIPDNFLRELKNRKIKIISIDDPYKKRLECDLVFYPPVESAFKLNWDGFKGKYFIGWQWVPIRKEFRVNSTVNSHKFFQKKNKEKKDLLMTMGGTDPKNLTKLILSKLDKRIFKMLNFKVLLGDSYLFKDQLKKLIEIEYKNIKIINGTKNISELMRSVDLAICSFGITAYELAALNIPSFHVCLNSDHIDSSKLFSKYKMAYCLGDYKFLKSSYLNSNLINLLNEPSVFNEFKQNCEKTIDVNGSVRIAKEITKLL